MFVNRTAASLDLGDVTALTSSQLDLYNTARPPCRF